MEAVVDDVSQALLAQTDGTRNFNENVTKDGRTILCEWFNTPLKNERGEATGVASLVLDITERKAQETELIAAKTEAERANRAKSDFLSSMSHELRAPLHAILGFAQLLEYDRDAPLLDAQRKNTMQIIKSGRHLLALIDQVLELSTIESGKTNIYAKDFSLRDLMKESISYVTEMAKRRAISVEYDEGDFVDLVVRADRTRLKQCVLNLLSNAVTYNRRTGTVGIGGVVRNDMMHIVVTDTGPDIPAEQQARLFTPFDRLAYETSDIEGTGIGLTITRDLVHLMGGEIGFDSEEGSGTSFWIDSPLVPALADAPAETEVVANDDDFDSFFGGDTGDS